jgi:site-specific recombinase XerD
MNNNQLFFSMTFEFLEIFLPKQCGRSIHTIKSYKDSLTIFRRYLLEQKGIKIGNFTFIQCTRELVIEFLDFITNRGCANSTRNYRLTAIKSYLAFAADKNISLQSIFLSINNIKQLKVIQPERNCLPDNAITAILSQPDVYSLMGIRDSTLLVLLYDSGVRLAELLTLRIENIRLNGDNAHIRVFGKGSKERVISISQSAVDYIVQYLKLFRTIDNNDTDLLFYTVIKGKYGQMSERNVERLLQKYADQAREQCPEIPIKVHPHMFRRARATRMYQQGVPLPLVSRFLGHSSQNTTKIYATPSVEMMRAVISSSSLPLGPSEEPIWDSEDEAAKNSGLR